MQTSVRRRLADMGRHGLLVLVLLSGVLTPPAASAVEGPTGSTPPSTPFVHHVTHNAIDPGPSRLRAILYGAEPTAAELDWMMERAMYGDVATSGTAGDIFSLLELTLGGGAAIPGYGKGFAIGAAAALAYKLTMTLEAKVFPSRFSKIDIVLEPDTFFEDDPEPGTWRRLEVSATSEGWLLGPEVVALLVGPAASGLAGKLGLAAKHFSGKAAEKAFLNLLETTVGYLQSLAVQAANRKDGTLKIPPREYGPVDLSKDGWHVLNIIGPAVESIGEHHYAPRRVGSATFRVAPEPGRFGAGPGKHIVLEKTVHVLPIRVTVTPATRFVEAGEVVTLEAAVNNALDTRVMWTIDSGGGEIIAAEQVGSNLYTAKIRLPAPLTGPVRVRATSIADRSHLDVAPERSATATLKPRQLTIVPSRACLTPGQSLQFGTLEAPADTVRWTASNGSISADGRFVAAVIGPATIAAVSQDDSGLRDEVAIDVAKACASSCTFRATVHIEPIKPSIYYIRNGKKVPIRRTEVLTGRAEISDSNHQLHLYSVAPDTGDRDHLFTVDISALPIGGTPTQIVTSEMNPTSDHAPAKPHYKVQLQIDENADPGDLANWDDLTLHRQLDSGLGYPERLAMRRLRGSFSAMRKGPATGVVSYIQSMHATFDAGNGPYLCDGGLEASKNAMKIMLERFGGEADPSKLDGLFD